MNKEIKRYTYVLSLLGIINVSLIVLSINAVIVLNFPEYQDGVHIWNTFGVIIPLVPLIAISESKGENRWWKVILVVLTSISVLLAKGNVARTGWSLSLSVFMIPALFAPRPGGKILMERPRIWHVLVFIVSYGIGQITNSFSLSALEVVVIYIFFVIWVLSININGFLKKIRDNRKDVDVDSILKENRRQIILFIAIFTLLSVLIPFFIDNLNVERKESEVVYEWGETREEEDEDEFYKPIVKEKGLSKEAKAFDLATIGNILMWVFVFSVIGILVLECVVLIIKIRDIDGRKEKHKDQFQDDFLVESIIEKERRKKSGHLFLSLSDKIRRLYKKSVEKYKKDNDLSIMSTKEINDEVLLFDTYEFTSIYEATRYSLNKVEPKDYERMKVLLKEKKKSSK